MAMRRALRRPSRPPVPPLVADLLTATPIQAVDVGAARGVPGHWHPYLRYLRVDAFEPDAQECARLAARSHPNVSWHPTALAGASGTRELHVLATPTGSSFFPPDPAFVDLFGLPGYSEVVDVVTLDCTSLGDHLDVAGRPAAHLLKLDTQGSELEILGGLRREQLDGVLAVEIETELHEAYQGQPLFPEVHAFMEEAGLALLDFRVQRAHLTGGVEERFYLRRHLATAVGTRELTAQAHALDALYVRPLREMAAAPSATALARYATILQAYRYYDGIFWLLDQPGAREALDEGEHAHLVRAYERLAPRPSLLERTGRLPHVVRRGRRGLSHVAERVLGVDGFDPPRTSWTHTYWPDS